ncbi:bifunctional acetate--CoA ligase family protein/GNAT family N-acetyltransferase [Alkalimarinus alittae]|uniref:Bifunctional acetate--CoA ligase family protein/GNAT family N-acetyltransferase n=1 Tax=Alkalimarinus alittae TaxID=2961619 RepID=A0ABY6N6D2_9ALTE|nr:bifunctional acetate--CoA ligase family protein/GNAT family N-acetyltransferase [Alkalimarinus alittae]UZE97569.1 bifunctional acetate--CoA ligase family protein/GNAT family N-acetyltransferase [Alkalimarinus alittae]
MSTRHLDALFNPKSIVILGASERSLNLGGIVLRNLLSSEYPGQLLVVNPNEYDNVHGIPCVKKVTKMPFTPDLAIVCTPPESVPRDIKKLGQMGVKTAMILTGGLSRTHSKSGRPLMYSVRDAAKKSGIRILGPNTIGIMAPRNKVNATYLHMGALPGKIAFIGQSGTIASAVVDWAFSRGVGFSHFLTLGDSMDIEPDDLMDYLAQDRHTKAILLHIEMIRSPARFISAVRAASRGKLVIGIKSGRVPESQWEPVPLADGITNGDAVFDALFRRAGMLRVNGADEMFDALETLTRMKPVKKDTLVIMSNGLGPNVLAVDRLANLGGELAELSEQTIDAIAELMPPYWTRKNPIDLNYDASPETYAAVMDILAKDKGVSNVLVMYAPSLTEDSLQIADSVITKAKRARLNIFTCWLGQSTVLDAREAFFEAGIPTFFSPEKAIKAFMHLVNHQRSQRLLRETPSTYIEYAPNRVSAKKIVHNALQSGRNHLSNGEARQLITDYGVPTVETWYCDDVEEVVDVFKKVGGPINITLLHEKSSHPFLEEKTGRGRYKTTIRRLNEEHAIISSCGELFEQYKEHFPNSGFLGYSVHCSHQHIGGLGFSLGITRDPNFGPLVVCGAAGASVNVMTDRRVALPPLNMVLAKDLLSQTYMYQLLKEYSYRPAQDIQAVCETLITLSQIVVDIPEIKGLEILPLLFNKDGVVAVDIAIDLGLPAKLSIQPYPAELAEWITLPLSKRRVQVRPIIAEDEPAHIDFHLKQSPESIRFRFFHYRKSFSHEELAQMVQIDYDREMVFVATVAKDDGSGNETLGTVRVWTDSDNLQCEFAVIVSDELKGERLGFTLMTKMIEYCKSRGTVEMIGSVLPDNKPMLRLAEKLGFESKWDPEEEVMALRLPLNVPKDEWQKEQLK